MLNSSWDLVVVLVMVLVEKVVVMMAMFVVLVDGCNGGQIDGYGAGGGKGQCVGEGAVGVPSHPGAR